MALDHLTRRPNGGRSAWTKDTERPVRAAGFDLDDILPQDQTLTVRKAANLHTGGMIRDVTASLHPDLAGAAVRAAQALNIPIVGLDLIVDAVDESSYIIIEANERPGLANHEPQPTAERFVDLLFPQTAAKYGARARPTWASKGC